MISPDSDTSSDERPFVDERKGHTYSREQIEDITSASRDLIALGDQTVDSMAKGLTALYGEPIASHIMNVIDNSEETK